MRMSALGPVGARSMRGADGPRGETPPERARALPTRESMCVLKKSRRERRDGAVRCGQSRHACRFRRDASATVVGTRAKRCSGRLLAGHAHATKSFARRQMDCGRLLMDSCQCVAQTPCAGACPSRGKSVCGPVCRRYGVVPTLVCRRWAHMDSGVSCRGPAVRCQPQLMSAQRSPAFAGTLAGLVVVQISRSRPTWSKAESCWI